MKKIFAFILATIMVVSLVPASVFAALSNCQKNHTVENCVAVKTEPATCTSAGYTVYECETCHTQFLADFVAELGHDYSVSTADDKHEDVAPNCKTGAPGKTWAKCSRCGANATDGKCDKTCKNDKCELGYVVVEAKCNPVQTSADLGCLTVYTCTECDKVWYKNAKGEFVDKIAHDWEYDTTKTQPGYDANGEEVWGMAAFKCTVCEDVTSVQIKPWHNCELKEVSKYVAPKCGVAGAYAKWQCEICLTSVYKDADGKVVKDSKDGVIKALDHTEGKRLDDMSTCTAIYACGREDCKGTITKTVHLKKEIFKEEKATCLTPGYIAYTCLACETFVNEVTKEATGHKFSDPKLGKASTCVEMGYNIKTCEGCGLEVKEDLPYDFTEKGHNIVTNPTDATVSCGESKVVVTYCANGCSEYEPDIDVVSKQHDWWTSKEWRTCGFDTSYSKGQTWMTMTEETCANCGITRQLDPKSDITVKTDFAKLADAEYYHGILKKVGTRAEDGKVTYKYEPISYSDSDKKPHKLTQIGVKVKANCTTNEIGIYKCSHCTILAYVEVLDTMTDHEANDKGLTKRVEATCTKEGNVAYYTCKICGKNYDEDGNTLSTVVINKHVTDKLVERKTSDKVQFCTITTYYECTAEGCGKTFKKADATQEFDKNNAHGTNWSDIHVKNDSVTCGSDGKVDIRRCTACLLVEASAVIDGNKEILAQQIQTKNTALTLTLKYNKKAIKFSADKDADGKIKITNKYKLDKSSDPDLKIPAMQHTDILNNKVELIDRKTDDVSNDTCQGVTYQHWYCKADECDYEYLYMFNETSNGCVNSKGELLTSACVNHKDAVCKYCSKDYNKDADWSEMIHQDPTCSADGYDLKYCLDCGDQIVTNVVLKKADNHKEIDVTVDPSFAGAGSTYTYCEWCNTIIDEPTVLPAPSYAGVEIMLDTDKATYKPGDFVYVTVSLDSLMGVEVWGANFSVSYNHKVFKYEDFEFCMNDGSLGFNSVNDIKFTHEYIPGEKFADGIVSVAVNTAEGIEVKGSFDLVVLKFKVIADVADTFEFKVGKVNGSGETPYGPVDPANEYSYSVVGVNGIKLESMLNEKNKTEVEIDSFLDLNDDGVTDMADAFQLYYLYTQTEDYIAEADVNCDGDIDDEDIVDLYHILTGAISLADYINPTETTTPDGPQPRA